MKASIRRESTVELTPRVLQLQSLFDVPVDQKLAVNLDVNLPIEGREWQVGLIVGPSGSGKTLLARELWPESLMTHTWDDRAVVDNFPDMPIKQITGLLASVGLGSIPAWMKPYKGLSNGEMFRADIARLMAETPKDDIAVVDEFTSVVDRQVAKVASHAVQKAVRRTGRRLIAVTCHYDVAEWLQADWTYNVAAGELTWGRVQPASTDPVGDLRRRPLGVVTI